MVMLRKARGESKRDNRAEDEHLYDEMRSLIFVMTFIGGWPVRQTKRGYESITWMSGPMLWCYAQVAFETVSMIACVHSTIESLTLGPLPFVDQVIQVLHIMYETVPMVIPLVHWHRGRQLAKYFNEWSDLQSSWVEVTGTPLRADSCRYGRWIGPVILLWSTATTYYHSRVVPDMFPWKVPLYTLVVVQLASQTVLWSALNKEIAATSGKLRAHLRQCLRRPGCGPRSVRGCCALWLRLRSLAAGLGCAWGPVIMHCLLVITLMGLTACFGLLAAVRMHVLRRCLSTAVTVVFAVIMNNSMCSSVDFAVTKVSRDLRDEILSTPLGGLPAETAEEIVRLVRVIQYKPMRFTLNGFVVVDRRFSISIASTATTYIVVLAQLAIALQSEDT